MGPGPKGREERLVERLVGVAILGLQWGPALKAGRNGVSCRAPVRSSPPLQWGPALKAGRNAAGVEAGRRLRRLQWGPALKAGRNSFFGRTKKPLPSLQWGPALKAGRNEPGSARVPRQA